MARRFDRLSHEGVKSPRLLKHGLDKMMTDLESGFGDIEQLVSDLADAVADIAAAQAAADDAAADAAAAQSTATNASVRDSISSSWVSPGAVLSAADVGADCTITIASHTRKYGDGTSLAITGSTITGRAFSTTYYVYYDDATRSDTTPSFQSTTNANTAAYNAASGRHFVGKIVTPADGAAGTSGGTYPPGYDPNDLSNIP